MRRVFTDPARNADTIEISALFHGGETMDKEPCICVNMDATHDVKYLKQLAHVHMLLSLYAQHKACAVQARLDGNIQGALHYESECDRFYNSIPEAYRVW